MEIHDAQTADAADVTNAVRSFYERHPYPPPVDGLETYRRRWQDERKRRVDHHLVWPRRAYRDDHSILVAGCGTSQAAKHALRWPEAQVTGIDFSATSVQRTEALKRKHGLDNLHVHQLPLERVGELETTFDQIVCTGVLHHLPDPDVGLRALRGVLAPGGAMQLMLYAPYGRAGIYMLQDYCRRVGIDATDEGIEELVAALGVLPPGHPLAALLREAPDFRQKAALADALLHPRDRAYSVPQLFDFLARGRLQFGRWTRQAPYDARCGVMARVPHAARIAGLPPVERYAAAELFRGTMVRHSLVVHRDDDAQVSCLDVSGEAWLHHVPLRVPETICVEERLPPGAAAVLINPAHTFTDIYLPLDAAQKRLFDAIDGKRTISEIAEIAAAGTSREEARDSFERLFRYDQIVLDASTAARP